MLNFSAVLVGCQALIGVLFGVSRSEWHPRKALPNLQHASQLAWLDLARRHRLVIERLGVEVDCLVLIHRRVSRLRHKRCHIVAL